MENDYTRLPDGIQNALARFDYLSNRIKLDYLENCCTRSFDQRVINELELYYGKPALVAGGMNEAFRWCYGNEDVENVATFANGEPFGGYYQPRSGHGRLFQGGDPCGWDTAQLLNALDGEIASFVRKASSIEEKLTVMAEYLAIKVTYHDTFIHGRSSEPAKHLFSMPFIMIERHNEADYIQAALDEPPDTFRFKTILSYVMASGVDPLGAIHYGRETTQDRPSVSAGIQQLSTWIEAIDLKDFFRWDVFGICNFLEGPVFIRKEKTQRGVWALADAWERYNWMMGSCTEASDWISHQVIQLVLDHSRLLPSTSVDYFYSEKNRLEVLNAVRQAREHLESLYEV